MLSDSEYLHICERLHSRSHDPHRQVGAIIVDAQGVIISEGTNATPDVLGLSNIDSLNEIRTDPKWKYFVLEHAERNAISAAVRKSRSLENTTMYVTLYPCADCARAIAASGISRLVVPRSSGDLERDKKWHDHYQYAQKIFSLAGIKVDFV